LWGIELGGLATIFDPSGRAHISERTISPYDHSTFQLQASKHLEFKSLGPDRIEVYETDDKGVNGYEARRLTQHENRKRDRGQEELPRFYLVTQFNIPARARLRQLAPEDLNFEGAAAAREPATAAMLAQAKAFILERKNNADIIFHRSFCVIYSPAVYEGCKKVHPMAIAMLESGAKTTVECKVTSPDLVASDGGSRDITFEWPRTSGEATQHVFYKMAHWLPKAEYEGCKCCSEHCPPSKPALEFRYWLDDIKLWKDNSA
jgi:hypothetical protein